MAVRRVAGKVRPVDIQARAPRWWSRVTKRHILNVSDKRPTLRWRNLAEYVRGVAGPSQKVTELLAAGKAPCINCGTSGRVIAPYEQPCPVEGYKMADRTDCPRCAGQGWQPLGVWRAAYKEEKTAHRAKLDAWRQRAERRQELMHRLGPAVLEEVLKLWR